MADPEKRKRLLCVKSALRDNALQGLTGMDRSLAFLPQ
jgi:hypothetical protein